jgi:rubredoxin
MGGYGSGRCSNLPATDEAKRVDIRYLRKQGLLRPGYWRSLSWTSRGEPSGNVRYKVEGNTFTLDYKVREYGDDWESVKFDVPLVTLPCRYGGNRYYFLCPGLDCGRRCELLYSAGKYFVCRKCAGYLYSSQKGDRLEQIRNAKDKIGNRIFEDYDGEWGYRKKKGMHQKTFDRGYVRYCELAEQWNMQFSDMARALGVGV